MNGFTKKGDTGKTNLNDKRLSKSDYVFEAIGVLDEVVASLALVRSHDTTSSIRLGKTGPCYTDIILNLQKTLITIQVELAGSPKTIDENTVGEMEHIIDYIQAKIQNQTNAIIPGSNPVSAHLDFARAIARRAERIIVRAMDYNSATLGPWSMACMNRLSTMLDALARYAEVKQGITPQQADNL